MSPDALQINESHWLLAMLHDIDVGLVVLDRDYNIQIWNGFMENHSGLLPSEVKNKNILSLFPEIPQNWFKRKAESVFLLKNKAFTIWEQRPYVFKFKNYRPITGTANFMYQNSTFIPLFSINGEVNQLCLIIYDVTDNAVYKSELELANKELSILNQTDYLTLLFNRNHWASCLLAEFKRWSRSYNVSCLVMIDIDHLKKINDRYGYLVGDEVIRHLSGIIRDYARKTDVSGRYTGEEFAMLLPDTSLKNSNNFAERIRKSVEQSIVKYNDIKVKYTVSLGVAEISNDIKNHEQWIELAEKALYQAKEDGGNRITLQSTLE